MSLFKRKRAKTDRRSGKDRRINKDLAEKYFAMGGTDPRKGIDRRSGVERRSEWIGLEITNGAALTLNH